MKASPRQFLSRAFVFICLVYLVLYVLSASLFESRITHFQAHQETLLAHLQQKVPSQVSVFLSRRSPLFVEEKPSLFRPIRFMVLLLGLTEMRMELEAELKTMLTSFKDQLKQVNLSELAFVGPAPDLMEADFQQADLRQVVFEGANFSRSNFSEADFREARLRGTKFNEAILKGANLSNVDLRAAQMIQVDLRESTLFYADFTGADLTQSNLNGVTMSGADFRKVIFKGANLSQAILGGARLDGADFTDAKLKKADLRYADLSKTIGLTQKQLKGVLMDHNTRLPEGF